jgi:hypothetical protein
MKKSGITRITTLLAVVGLWAGASSMSAPAQVTFTASGTGSNGEALQAWVEFQTLTGNKLQITLANTAPGDAHSLSNILTAVFFDGAIGLTPVSATVQAGQKRWDLGVSTTLSLDLNVGTQWAYAYAGGGGNQSLGANPPNNAAAGISSAGFNWFGAGNFAANGAQLDGAAYGLVPLGFRDAGGNYDGFNQLNNNPIFENSTVFTLSGWTGNLSDIANVSFQYGTGAFDVNIVSVPEPTTAGCFLLGLVAPAGFRRFAQKRRS